MFRLTAEALRAAGGQVRCGRCGEIFDALARLAEEPTAFTVGETSLDLEVRADAILESGAASDAVHAMPETLHASPESLHASPDAGSIDEEVSLEFTLPPGELDRIFVESHPKMPSLDGLESIVIEAGEAPDDVFADLAGPREIGLEVPEHVRREMLAATAPKPVATPPPAATPAPPAAAVRAATPPPTATSTPATASKPAAPKPAAPKAVATSPAATRAAATPVAAGAIAVGTLAAEARARTPEAADLPAPPHRAARRWIALAAVLALLLAGQIAADRRDWIETRTPLGPPLRSLFTRLGISSTQSANLAGYQLRQWGVTGDPQANGTLRVRASILNTTAQLEPYPLLRVTLLNRYGSRIGARDFEPAEYLGKPVARMLSPGERADATLSILDPGKDAEGFEIDVCLRRADKRVQCAADSTPPAAT